MGVLLSWGKRGVIPFPLNSFVVSPPWTLACTHMLVSNMAVVAQHYQFPFSNLQGNEGQFVFQALPRHKIAIPMHSCLAFCPLLLCRQSKSIKIKNFGKLANTRFLHPLMMPQIKYFSPFSSLTRPFPSSLRQSHHNRYQHTGSLSFATTCLAVVCSQPSAIVHSHPLLFAVVRRNSTRLEQRSVI